MTERWYVVKIKSGQEKIADRELRDAGFFGFYPTRLCRVISRGKKTEVMRPLYPLYTFSRFDRDNQSWGKILRLRGVDTILGVRKSSGKPLTWGTRDSFGQPVPVPVGVVEALMQLAEISGGSIPVKGDQFTPLAQGTPIRVCEGPFAGLDGLVDQDQRTRVRILLDILGKQTPISISREALSLESGAAA
jgi:transcription antitermination factor NusG